MHGVSCNYPSSTQTSVTRIDWGQQSLSRPIPSSMGNLKSLSWLNLSSNQINGSIPLSIGDMTSLRSIYLGKNELSGSIPATIGNLKNLIFMHLSFNQLSGSLPSSLGDITNLLTLSLEKNQLSGAIPSSIGNLVNLATILLDNNQLSGAIPSSISTLPKLKTFSISNNPLLSGSLTPRCETYVYAGNTGITLCGCASVDSPAVRFPPVRTPDACLATGPASPLVKRTLAFSTAIGSYKFTCNVDSNLNPFQDCLNTMGKLCDPTYMSSNPSSITTCKDAVNTMTLGMSVHWQDVRKHCGQWSIKGSEKSPQCSDANIALQNNAYYIGPDGSQIKVSSALTDSVVQGLWSNPALKG